MEYIFTYIKPSEGLLNPGMAASPVVSITGCILTNLLDISPDNSPLSM